jgi:hypothetical protein
LLARGSVVAGPHNRVETESAPPKLRLWGEAALDVVDYQVE